MLFYNQRGTTALFERNTPPLYISEHASTSATTC